jgi:acetylornithine deacetylase
MTDLAALLARLVAVDTHNPGGDEPRMAALCAEELRARRPDELEVVSVSPTRSYVWARWGTPRVVVNAHLDTVPPNAGWSGDPYTARVVDGKLYGLGSADTKGAIAAILGALDEARPRDLAVLFSGDEELGGTCMRAFAGTERARGLTYAVVCEPTSCRAGVRHRGVMALDVKLAGKGGHSSKADRMPAPIAELARVAVAMHEWGIARREAGPTGFPGMCLNVAKLDGGVAFNVVPEHASLSVSLRPPPGADQQALRAELVALARRVAPACEVEVMLDNPPFATRALESFRPWLGDVVDGPIDLAFWTEAAVFAAAGIDAVVFGPGDIGVAHAADEFVPLADLARARDVFAAMFRAV